MRATTRAWAERLLALEEASGSVADAHVHVWVVDKLRDSHAPVFGPEAFIVLLKRALVLARSDVSSLKDATLTADGRMEGLVPGDSVEATLAITAHFLELLITFVGEAFTLRLLREAWPDAALENEEPR